MEKSRRSTSAGVHRIFVVGCNRPRLLKIMEIVKVMQAEEDQTAQLQQQPESSDVPASPPQMIEPKIDIEFVPCIARMDSYTNERGEQIRYLASLVYCADGSSLTQFFDDDDVRESLAAVIMVGYEWHGGVGSSANAHADEGLTQDHSGEYDGSGDGDGNGNSDQKQIKNYFAANNLEHLEVELVRPNFGFQTLHEEMDHFKKLDPAAKKQHIGDRTMGPGKMAERVIDMGDHVKEEKLEIIRALEQAKAETEAAAAAEKSLVSVDAETARAQQHEKMKERKIPDVTKQRYACRKCRFMLLDETDLSDDHVKNLHSFNKRNYQKNRPMSACQSIFCRDSVLEWLAPDGCEVEGRLECPKCSTKIGHWRWSGAQCSCGTWITPSIQIPLSKVDTVRPNSANQMPTGFVVSPFVQMIHPTP